MNIYDPWKNNSTFPINESEIQIKIRNNFSNTLRFLIKRNKNNINIITKNINTTSKISSTYNYPHLYISIKNSIGYIKTIQAMTNYSGSQLMNLAIKILKNMNVHICELDDVSVKICKFKINAKNIKFDINYKILSLFKHYQTYYMKFGFKPMDGINDKSEKLKELVIIIKKNSWDNIESCINLSRNGILQRMFNYAIDNWNNFKAKYKTYDNTPFVAISKYSDEDCYLFTYWLSYIIYISTTPNIVLKNLKNKNEIEFITYFNQLLNILMTVKWIKDI
jgi:hypothetical protein